MINGGEIELLWDFVTNDGFTMITMFLKCTIQQIWVGYRRSCVTIDQRFSPSVWPFWRGVSWWNIIHHIKHYSLTLLHLLTYSNLEDDVDMVSR